jgi:hypothetical protein
MHTSTRGSVSSSLIAFPLVSWPAGQYASILACQSVCTGLCPR